VEKLPAPELPADSTLLVDASSYLFRAWFGVPDVFTDSEGRPLNAVVGFARSLGRMLRAARPARVAIAFDEALFSGFRHRLDPGYKSGRVLPDDALAWQMHACRQLVSGLGLAGIASGEFEADDLIASMAARERRAGRAVVIASEDKDLAQLLVTPADRLWQVARHRVLDAGQVEAWLGVPPVRLPELQALTGDPVDGIPGVPGIGRKTGATLLAACTHIESLLDEPMQVQGLPVRGAARLARELAGRARRVRLNLKLTTLAADATGLPPLRCMSWRPPSASRVASTVARIGLPAGSGRHFLEQ
jgi:5'-3' exonuclease